MLVPRKTAQSEENVIGRRLVETMVSGGVRPIRKAETVRRANPAGSGLFLVRPGTVKVAAVEENRSSKMKPARARKIQSEPEVSSLHTMGRGRVLQMPAPRKLSAELDLRVMLRPLSKFGHAALAWLKVV